MGPPSAVAELLHSLDLDPVGPAHASDRCLLVNADCKRVLPKIPSTSVHLVMIDPPYGAQVQSEEDKKWDKAWSEEEWHTIVDEVFRVLKPGGHFVIFSGGKPFHTIHSHVLAAYVASFGTPPSYYDLVWYHNANDSRKTQRHIPRSHHENILVYFRTGDKEKVMIQNGCLTRTTNDYEHTGRGSVLMVPKDDCRSKEEATVQRYFARMHSSKATFDYKPENLLKHLIHDYTHPNCVVLDFCGRHMLCGKAALSMDRHFIGVEVEREAYNRGVSRLEDKGVVFHSMQTSMGRASHDIDDSPLIGHCGMHDVDDEEDEERTVQQHGRHTELSQADAPIPISLASNNDRMSEASTISVADSIEMNQPLDSVARKTTIATRPRGRAPSNKEWDYQNGGWIDKRSAGSSAGRATTTPKQTSAIAKKIAVTDLPPKWRKRMNYGKKMGYIGPEGKAANARQAWIVYNARSV